MKINKIDIIGWTSLPLNIDNYITITPNEIKEIIGIDILKYNINTNRCSFLDLVFLYKNNIFVALVPKQFKIIWEYMDKKYKEKIINFLEEKIKND